ncbi:hypothetical protein P7C70_g9626, partial [Phenoliferia sp. Uapishka_3]
MMLRFLVLLVPPVLLHAQLVDQSHPLTPISSPPASSSSLSESELHLIKLSYQSREETQLALESLTSESHDIWSFKSTQITLSVNSSTLQSLLYPTTNHLSPSYSTQVLSPLSTLLGQPTIQSDYNRALSNAILANLSTTPDYKRDQNIHSAFHDYDNMVTIMRGLVEQFPAYAKMVQVGRGAEGRG